MKDGIRMCALYYVSIGWTSSNMWQSRIGKVDSSCCRSVPITPSIMSPTSSGQRSSLRHPQTKTALRGFVSGNGLCMVRGCEVPLSKLNWTVLVCVTGTTSGGNELDTAGVKGGELTVGAANVEGASCSLVAGAGMAADSFIESRISVCRIRSRKCIATVGGCKSSRPPCRLT